MQVVAVVAEEMLNSVAITVLEEVAQVAGVLVIPLALVLLLVLTLVVEEVVAQELAEQVVAV